MLSSNRQRAACAALATASLAAALLTATAQSASAAPDITPPVIKTNLNVGFVVGSVVTQPARNGWDYAGVQEFIKWTVTDNSGRICDMQVLSFTYEYYERLIADLDTVQTTPYTDSINVWGDEYSGQEGSSGDSLAGWAIKATDCAGNATQRAIGSKFELLEENNFTQYERGDDGTITYAGAWSTVTCACASRGAMKKTSAKGASFTYTDYWNRDDHLGLVMAKGPGRGSADVYVDGVKVATVNTYAATTQNRVIVYDRWMTEGTHVVKVVNLATKGHGRIDLDAVLNS